MSAVIWDSYLPYLIGGGVVVATAIVIFLKRRSRPENFLVDAPDGTVVLRQIPRGPYAPNLSPFPMKLETYLRMAKIPYKNVFGMEMSPKTQKTPWAQFNGEILTDSQLIIDHLNKQLNIDTMSHLSATERGTCRAFQRMTEEASYWCIVRWRWTTGESDKFLAEKCDVPSFIVKFVRRALNKACHGQGIGRLDLKDVYEFFRRDMEAVSAYLGDKKYLTGDKPCETDCALFGMLGQVKWHMPDSPMLESLNSFPNLHAYCDRMKETFWPDWDECITHGNTKEAQK